MTQRTENRILCIEDRLEMAEMLKTVLSALPARVDAASSGESAMDMLRDSSTKSDPYSLFVLDMHVPHAPGEAVDEEFGRIAQESLRTLMGLVPVIVFTGYPTFKHCVECIQAGALDYIPKVDPITDAKGIQLLFSRCEEIFSQQKPAFDLWLEAHLSEIIEKYGGMHIGVIAEEYSRRIKYDGDRVGGWAVIPGFSHEAVRNLLIQNRLLAWTRARIIEIPGREGLRHV